jgi:hypothetical protein
MTPVSVQTPRHLRPDRRIFALFPNVCGAAGLTRDQAAAVFPANLCYEENR